MKKRIVLPCVLVALALARLGWPAAVQSAETDGHSGAPTGTHGGRLVGDAVLQVEVLLFETGVAPQMRLWIARDGRPLPPSEVSVSLVLHRLARPPQTIVFHPVDDFLLGEPAIGEPHSFRVDIEALHAGHTMRATYETIEARVGIPLAVATASGVTSELAAPRDLERSLRLTGRVGIAADRLATVKARFPSLVLEARGSVGDRVRRGDLLASLESNASLSRYGLSSPLTGVLLERRAVAGTTVTGDDVLYTVADLSRVQADLDVYGQDAPVVKAGEEVQVRDDAHGIEARTTIAYVSPLRDVHTQTTLVRAEIDNPDGHWSPGAFVSATIRLEEAAAAVAVPPSALQTWRQRDAVFVHADGVWEARPVRIGRRGERWVEVLEGLDAGTVIATGNTFLLRAEIEKAGASHDH